MGSFSTKSATEKNKNNNKGKTILCPTCDLEVDIPTEGTYRLPINFILHHQMAMWKLTEGEALAPCDLCTDSVGIIRCVDCPAFLCNFCSEAHRRQKRTNFHHLLSQHEARSIKEDGQTVASRRKKILCERHTSEELSLFCETCCVTACRDCCLLDHRGHCCRFIADVGQRHTAILKNMVNQLKPQVESIQRGIENIKTATQQLNDQVEQVTQEVSRNTENHIRAIEDHRDCLIQQAAKIKDEKKSGLRLQHIQMEQALEDIESTTSFVTQLLSLGSPTEILSLLSPVKKRLQDLYKERYNLTAKVDTIIRFLPTDRASEHVNSFPVTGIVTCQIVSPANCILRGNGLQAARQGQKADALMIARDMYNHALSRGGDDITAEMVSKDEILRYIPVQIIDKCDGTYMLTFSPDQTGLFNLIVKVQGKHIQGSPFPVAVRPQWRPHTGVYHCCTFCSSNGSKEARCACGGSMPGGFKGCGHSYVGHPGKKHWSCCGKTVEKSECVRPLSVTYQFTI